MAAKRKAPSRNINVSFFNKLRPWSEIKNDILKKYLQPYLNKVKKFSSTIFIIDTFAGQGYFEEDKVHGSPLIICEAIKSFAPNQAKAILVNRKESHHNKLTEVIDLHKHNDIATLVHADGPELLKIFRGKITNETVLIYMDPFGIKGCDFSIIESFLERGTRHSTEFIINLNMPILHRYAPQPIKRELLNKVLGGNYWDPIFNSGMYETPADKDFALIKGYEDRLRSLFKYVGSCPVNESRDSQIKYFVTFCSRSHHTLTLMNDIMCDAYHNYMYQTDLEDIPLFKDAMPDWKSQRLPHKSLELTQIINSELIKNEGITRKLLWVNIADKYFSEFRTTEFNKTIRDLIEKRKLFYDIKTGMFNDDTKLFLHEII